MKTGNFVLTALALFMATAVTATKIPTLNVIGMENQKALLAFEAAKPSSLEISLTDKMGETLYYKKTDDEVNEFRMILNFQELNDGIYDVCLNYNDSKLTRKITLASHSVKEVGETNRTFKPYWQFENNLLKISYLNTTQKNVTMNILSKGQLVAGKKLGKEMCIQKVYDLSKLEGGEYDVVLGDNTNEYRFAIKK